MMQAVVITAFGPPQVLKVQARPMPVPLAEQVLVSVKAAGVNRPDVFQRMGKYPAPEGVIPDVPGLEVAGIIEYCGDRVETWKPGDRVCALVPGGGYAEYAAVHESHCLPIPKRVDFLEAACLPETIFTVWHNVFQLGGLKKGETLLVHGGSGGIGTTAIQLATLAGAKVYATAGSPEKCKACEQLGASACINYKEEDFYEHLKDEPIDVILDSIGAPYFERNIKLLAEGGRLVFINAIAGKKVQMDVLALMKRQLTVMGSTLRGRENAFKSALRESIEQAVWPWVETGKFRPVIDRAFRLSDASQAHELMESGGFVGKLVLTV